LAREVRHRARRRREALARGENPGDVPEEDAGLREVRNLPQQALDDLDVRRPVERCGHFLRRLGCAACPWCCPGSSLPVTAYAATGSPASAPARNARTFSVCALIAGSRSRRATSMG